MGPTHMRSTCPCPPMVFWKKTGSHWKNWIFGQKSGFLKHTFSTPYHVPSICVKSCENKKVPFFQINISLLPFFKSFLAKNWPILQFWPLRKNGPFSVPTLRFGSIVKSGSFFLWPGPSDQNFAFRQVLVLVLHLWCYALSAISRRLATAVAHLHQVSACA